MGSLGGGDDLSGAAPAAEPPVADQISGLLGSLGGGDLSRSDESALISKLLAGGVWIFKNIIFFN